MVIAYINNALLFVAASTFEEMHEILKGLITKENSVIEWSKDHNFPLEYSKLQYGTIKNDNFLSA